MSSYIPVNNYVTYLPSNFSDLSTHWDKIYSYSIYCTIPISQYTTCIYRSEFHIQWNYCSESAVLYCQLHDHQGLYQVTLGNHTNHTVVINVAGWHNSTTQVVKTGMTIIFKHKFEKPTHMDHLQHIVGNHTYIHMYTTL